MARLPVSFYVEVGEYIKNLEQLCKDEDAKSLQVIELKNVKNVLQDVYERREKKIVNIALLSVRGEDTDTKNLTPEENKLLDSLISQLKERRKETFSEVEKVKKENKERLTVRFLEEFPAFIGVDTKEYGPFSAGETTELPIANAEMLIKKGIIEK